jgi:arylsulfatase A-like enzyme
MVLSRCYAAAPICGPSRAALLTGKTTIHTGVRRNDQDLPAEEVTIAEALKPLGYGTGVFGKWQRGRPRDGRAGSVHPLDQGFDEFFGFTEPYAALEKFPTHLLRGRERVEVSGYIDDLITDQALDFISRHRKEPFFLYLPYLAPHFLVDAPKDEVAKHLGRIHDRDAANPIRARYAAMITRLDANVGRLLGHLERNGLTGDSLIVFTSDNGATFESGNQGASVALDSNRPFRGQKRTLWEGGIRVPGLACWPGRIPGGTVCRDNIQSIDLLPTFVAAARGTVNPAWHVEGVDILQVWTCRSPVPERALFWEWQGEGYDQLAAIRGDEKLVVTGGGKPELYDVAADPSERRDISPLHPERTQRRLEELKQWMKGEDPRCRE